MSELRLLIAAGSAAGSVEQLPPGVRALIDSATAIHVISPVLPGRFEWLASATDQATREADERLADVLGEIGAAGGTSPTAGVGADDPLLAFEDAVRAFSPDHILIGLRSADQAGWQERGLLGAVQERFRLPITVFEVAG